ncbi:MAG: chromosomal replication initiator protein DnaA [Erysipelotrichaceae bacterium]|nr:chromosomal replication initiator protein DnaA [Erysipelotrichaceae bacterium]
MINTLSEITQLWDKALLKIKERLSEDKIFDSFFEDSYIYQINGETITVIVNSALAVQLMRTKYYDLISDVVLELTETNFKLLFIQASEIQSGTATATPSVKKQEYFKDSSLNSSLTFDSFVVGPFNREASQAALLVARNPGKMFKVLYIHSNSGLGKTHLLHAIGNYILNEGNPNTKILYTSAQTFVEEYVKYSRGEQEAEPLKDYVSSYDVLLFDDVQFLSKKPKTQEMFFSIYEKMVNNGKQIVITSDKQPNEISDLEDRLVSRFNQGLVISIKEPDQNTCVQILEKKIESNGLDLSKFDESVLYFFAEKFSKNVRELEGALNRLIFHIVNLTNTDVVTLDVAAEAVQGLVGGNSIATQINEQKIINTVADYYSLIPSQITGKIRTGQIALARHIAIYLIRQELDVPLTKIGTMFGGKDHTTIMHAIKHVENELKTNPEMKEAVTQLQKRIK